MRRRGIAAVVALATAGSIALVLTGTTASATPATALQAVQVKLGADGSITGITSNLVSKSSDSSLTSSSQQLSPTALGSKLPLRVLVSYQHNGQQGTNLNDLVGKSGQFVINLTVQNTSVRPALDTDQSGRQSYALTGAPLTVVASADLGDPNLAHVITPGTGGTTGPATSGVLSTAPNGDAQVLYSALLVPPALPASTTFTLVENSSKFVVPTITIAAQPGVVTNPSASNLIQTAFGSSNNTEAARQNALALVGSVSTSLQDVLSTLTTMTQELQGGSTNLTGPTMDSLRTSTATLQSNLTGLTQILGQTATCLAGTINDSIDTPTASLPLSGCKKQTLPKNVQTQLGTAVNALQTLIQGPSTVPGASLADSLANAVQPMQFGLQGVQGTALDQIVPSSLTGSGVDACSAQVTSSVVTPNMSLLGQVKALQGWFDALNHANTLCAQTIHDNIVKTIGTITTPSQCSATDTTLACRFFAAATGVTSGISTAATSLRTAISSGQSTNQLSQLFNDLVTIRNGITTLSSGQLNGTAITGLQGALSNLTKALAPDVATVLATATQQQAALGTAISGSPSSSGTPGMPALSDLPNAIATICATPSPTSDQTAIASYLNNVSGACNPAGQQALTAQASAVASVMNNDLSQWTTVYKAAKRLDGDINGTSSLAQTLSGLLTQLTTTTVGDNGNGNGQVSSQIQQALQQLSAGYTKSGSIADLPSTPVLSPATATPTQPCATGTVSAPDGSVAKLFADFQALYCVNASFSSNVSSAIDNFTAGASPVAGSLNKAGADAGTLGTSESGRVNTFFTNFNTALTAASNLATNGNVNPNSLDAQALLLSANLGTSQNAINNQLHATAVDLLGRISTVFNQAVVGSGKGANATPGIKKAQATLAQREAQLVSALTGKNGLQSVLNGNTQSAQLAHNAVNTQVADSTAYEAVQSVASGQSWVTQKVLTQSLTNTLGAFGVQLPEGSQITSVYTYQLGGN